MDDKSITSNITAFVASEVKKGTVSTIIVQRLVFMGVEPGKAKALVDMQHGRGLDLKALRPLTVGNWVPTLFGATVAAALGGAAWGILSYVTRREFVFAPLALGAMTGGVVVYMSGSRGGLPLQVIAAASSVLGILIGKYIFFHMLLVDAVTKEHGRKAAEQVSLLSREVLQEYFDYLPQSLGGHDVLWVILALGCSWTIPMSVSWKTSSVGPPNHA